MARAPLAGGPNDRTARSCELLRYDMTLAVTHQPACRMWSPDGDLMEPRWRHEEQPHAAATVSARMCKHHGPLATPGRQTAWCPRSECGLPVTFSTSPAETRRKRGSPGRTAATYTSGYTRENLRAHIRMIDIDAGRSDWAIGVPGNEWRC